MQRKISSEQTYEGRIFTVSKDMVEDETGKQFARDIVHHNGGVGILVIKDKQVLLVKQYRPAADAYLYEIPAGKLEANENPYEAALRELEEETGFTTNKLDKICMMYSTPGFCSEILHIYQIQDLIPVENPKAMDEDEELELEWFSLAKAIDMIFIEEIIDAKTIVALQHAALMTK